MEELNALKELVKKELKEVGNKGLTSSNLESTYKLVDILKDLVKIDSEEEEMRRGDYGARIPMIPPIYENRGGGYNERGYGERGYGDGGPYMAGDNSGRGGGRTYNGYDTRMKDRINRVIDGAEMYEYGRDRYQHGGSHEAMEEGLEKMMYAICMLVETAMDAAQSPREKEIVRKHIKKLQGS